MTASPSLKILPWEETTLQEFLKNRKARLDRLAEQRRKNRNTPNIINKNACDQNSINFISDIINKLNVNTNSIHIPRKSTLQPVPQAPDLTDPEWLSFRQRSEEIVREKEDDKLWLRNRSAKITLPSNTTSTTTNQTRFPKSNWPNSRLRRF